MKRNLFKILATRLLLEAAAGPLAARAQQPATTEPIVINPNPSPPKVSLRASRESSQRARYQDADNGGDVTFEPIEPAPPKLQRWMRSSLGFWLSVEQMAVTNAQMQVTADEVLVGNSSEFGFGAGVLLDMPVPGAIGAQSVRLRSGLHRVNVTPNSDVNARYSGEQLETTLTAFSFGALYRYAPDFDFDAGTMWFGTGPEIFNVLDSNISPGRVSRLRQSWGLSWGAALGFDMRISDVNDVGFEADWYPGAGLSAHLSFRRFL